MRNVNLFLFKSGWLTTLILFTSLLATLPSYGQVSSYSFSQSTGTYTAITGGTVFSSTVATTFDSEVWGNLPIGFTFNYNGTDYSAFGINANGWISMGATTPVSSSTALSSGTTNNVISAASRDLYGRQFITATTATTPTVTMTAGSLLGVTVGDAMSGNGIATGAIVSAVSSPTVTMSLNGTSAGTGRNIRFHNGTIRYETIGTAPNRQLVVQWSKFSRYATTAPSDFMNFQIILNETTNNINIVYDFPYVNTAGTHQVGLRGASSADFNNRSTTSDWGATTSGATNSASCSVSNTLFPASGLTFSWSPPSCIAPTALTPSLITTNSATIGWTAAASATGGYEWELRTSGACGSGSPIQSGTTMTTSVNLTSLTPNTTYTYCVRSVCAGPSTSGYVSGTFTTQLVVSAPYTEPFASTSTPLGYNITGWTIGSTRGVTGNPGNNIYKNLYSSAITGTFTTVNVGPISSGMFLTFDYKNSNYDSPFAGPGVGTGDFTVSVSTDYGNTYTVLSTIGNTASNAWQLYSQDLSAYVGQNVKIRIIGNWVSGDYDLAFDNIKIETPPSCLPPTAITINTVTTNSSNFSWTASVSTPSDGYEWEVRSSGAPGSGATGLADNGSTGAGVTMDMATGLTEATTYSLYVRSNCGSGTFSNWTAATTFFTGYCIPAPSSVDGLGITNVTFGVSPNIVNNTSVAEPTNYGNYAIQIGDLQQNVSSSVSITYQTGYTYDTKIWIDFNDDLDFNDVGENVYTGVSTSANPTTLVATFTIPLSVSLGNHRLRIGGVDAGPPTTCYSGSFGTYEDYTVNVVAAPPNCVAPTNQPTSFVASNIGTETFTANFTAATSAPDNYIIVRYLTGETPTNPIDFTSYIVGQTIGVSGNVRSINSSTILNETGLTASTTYDYYIYSYNNVGCVGPVYNQISPLFGKVTTCAATTGTPGTPAASLLGTTSFTATWTASATPGVDYIIDVATNSLFTSFVSGYNGLNVGMVLTTPITGLSANTTYYVRVRADIGGCFSVNSAALTVRTLCNAESAPTSVQNFSTYTGSAPAPDCWTEATGVLAPSTTLAGTTSAWLLKSAGFANISAANPGVSINLYSTKNDWVISQPIDLGGTPSLHRISYNMAVTTYNGTGSVASLGSHKVDIVVSTDGGTTWTNANIVKSYTGAGSYSNTGQTEKINLTGYSGVIKIAFVATTTSTSPDIDFHIDDFIVEAIPTSAVDWGNLQFPGSGTIYTTNAFDTYGQTYEPGVTEGAGQGTGVLAWLGYNTADTDPNTWTNWIPATFNVQVGNNDEFIGTIPANTLTPGTYYYAYRYQLSGGPFVYGGYKASGGGIWDGSNNVSGVLTVNACPSVSASATMTTICQNTSTTISATSANPNYTYQWNPGSLVGASHLVSPSSSTSYVVTATDLGIACTSTASVSVNVVSGPSGVTANASPATICVGASTNLLGDANPNTVLLSESFESGLPSGWTVVNGGTGNNWTFPLSLSGSARTGTRAAQYLYNSTNPANTWLFTTGQNLTAGVTYTISSWYRTSASFPEKLKVTVGSAATIVSQTTVIQDLGTIQTATYTEQTATFTPVTTGVYYFAWNAYSDADEFFINLDDISITTPAMLSYNWTSTPSGFTSMSQNPTGIAPLVNTLYNLSVTDSNTGCANTASVNVQFATSAIVSSSSDSGAGTLRAAIECLGEGGTITYDQPTTAATILTTPLNITKSVTIQGLSSASRPEITVPAAGVSIDATKTLTLQNVDVKSSGTATFSGAGDVSITGTTVGKQ